MRQSLLTLVVVLLSGYAGTAAAQSVPAARDRGAMADQVRQRPEFAERLNAVITSARKVAATNGVPQTNQWVLPTEGLISSVPLTVTQEKLPDNTVCLGRKDNGWDLRHTCVVVRTVQSESSADLTTTVRAAR